MSEPAAERPSEAPTLPPPAPADEAATLPPALAAAAGDLAISPDGPPATVPGYEFLGELGRGGNGCRLQSPADDAAAPGRPEDDSAGSHAGADGLQRFRTEAIACLQHPYIVQIHEVGAHQGLPYFSLEFCSSGSLEQKLRGSPLRPKEAAAFK